MNRKKSCSNCSNGVHISINNDVLCRNKGVVSGNYVCGKHKFSSLTDSYKETKLKCIDCIYFNINTDNPGESSSIGLCQLFSVRLFDGRKKNTCSKFVKKRIQEVS